MKEFHHRRPGYPQGPAGYEGEPPNPVYPMPLDKIITEMGKGRAPRYIKEYFEQDESIKDTSGQGIELELAPEIKHPRFSSETLTYFMGQIDSICTLSLIGKSKDEERTAIRSALDKKRAMAEHIDHDYQKSGGLKPSDTDASPAMSYLEKKLQEFQ